MSDRIYPRLIAVAPALFAALCAVSYAIVFYPGAMGFDTAYQWWQARGGETSNIHGLAMTWLWRLSNALILGPGPLLVFQLALFWSGLALISYALPVRQAWRMIFILLAAGAPAYLLLPGTVISDAVLLGALTCALGLSLRARDGLNRAWLVPAMALLVLAFFVRKNALPAIFPLLLYLTIVASGRLPINSRSWFRALAIAVCVSVAMQGASLILDRTVDRRVTVFATTALWDLAAISLSTGQMLLPADSHGPGLTLDDLRNGFTPYSAAPLFALTHAGVRQPFLDPQDPLNAEIRRAWIDAILQHPSEYLAHRWRVTRALFGSKPLEWPREMVYIDGEYQYHENPSVAPNTNAIHAWLIRAIEAVRDTAVVVAWPYVALAVFAWVIAWRRRGTQQALAALAVLTSGLLYALPLPLIAPSAELRYLGWTCLSAVLGAALAFTLAPVHRRAQSPS
jgi:hypothetical protein